MKKLLDSENKLSFFCFKNVLKLFDICFMLCYDIVTKEMENKTRRSKEHEKETARRRLYYRV